MGKLNAPNYDNLENQKREFYYRKISSKFPELAKKLVYGDLELAYLRLINSGDLIENVELPPEGYGSEWFTGEGPPTTFMGETKNDKYLDVLTGNVYTFE